MGKKSNIRKIRENFEIASQEMARALGISGPVYSLAENGKRKHSQEYMERLYYNVNHVCMKHQKQKIEDSYNLEKNTYKKPEGKVFNSLDEEIQDELDFELHYQPLTEELIMEAIKGIAIGKTLFRVSADLEIDDIKLGKVLDKRGIKYETGLPKDKMD